MRPGADEPDATPIYYPSRAGAGFGRSTSGPADRHHPSCSRGLRGHPPAGAPIDQATAPSRALCKPSYQHVWRRGGLEFRGCGNPPPLITLVLRAVPHMHEPVTSTFSNVRNGYPQVSRAFFSTADHCCPRLHRAGWRGMAAGNQPFPPVLQVSACLPLARHRQRPTQESAVSHLQRNQPIDAAGGDIDVARNGEGDTMRPAECQALVGNLLG